MNGRMNVEILHCCRYSNAFELQTVAPQSQSQTSIIFCAETLDDRNDWVAAISKVCRFCCLNKMHRTALMDIFQVRMGNYDL